MCLCRLIIVKSCSCTICGGRCITRATTFLFSSIDLELFIAKNLQIQFTIKITIVQDDQRFIRIILRLIHATILTNAICLYLVMLKRIHYSSLVANNEGSNPNGARDPKVTGFLLRTTNFSHAHWAKQPATVKIYLLLIHKLSINKNGMWHRTPGGDTSDGVNGTVTIGGTDFARFHLLFEEEALDHHPWPLLPFS